MCSSTLLGHDEHTAQPHLSPPCPLHSSIGWNPDPSSPKFTPVVTSASMCFSRKPSQSPPGDLVSPLHSLKHPTCFCSICGICSPITDPVISYSMTMSPSRRKPRKYIMLITAPTSLPSFGPGSGRSSRHLLYGKPLFHPAPKYSSP